MNLGNKTLRLGQRKVVLGSNTHSSSGIVTYVIDTNNTITSQVQIGDSVLSFTPTKTGYVFLGWADSGISYTKLSYMVMTGYPITLYAIFGKPVTLTLVDANLTPNALTDYIYYNNGNTSSAPLFSYVPAVKVGYNFAGWCTSSAATTVNYREIKDTSFSTNTTLYAKYNVKTFFVLYSVTGDTHENYRELVVYGQDVLNPTSFNTPTKTGYTFLGWNTYPGATTVLTSLTQGLDDIMLYAIWA